ncbi:hypothetical protein [Vibrio gallaecicus]|nr:hypothetical protein [Vibrio gallaecicus]MDN3614140.1 hypothetical protein [Vibrio gallaecicus]
MPSDRHSTLQSILTKRFTVFELHCRMQASLIANSMETILAPL